MELVIKNHLKSLHLLYIFIALIFFSQCEKVQGTRRPRLVIRHMNLHYYTSSSSPNHANSPTLPPYKDVIGPSTPPMIINPPYCAYPPPNLGPNPPAIIPNPPSIAAPNPLMIAPNPPFNVPNPPLNMPNPPLQVPNPPVYIPSPPILLPPLAFPPPLPPPPPTGTLPGILWCVAKPTVPNVVAQIAMDYACGSGADCDMIMPSGPCYLPNTVMAHASYAFNSYWQRTKAAGGTCDFGGAAMLITKDPSYDGCRYIYT